MNSNNTTFNQKHLDKIITIINKCLDSHKDIKFVYTLKGEIKKRLEDLFKGDEYIGLKKNNVYDNLLKKFEEMKEEMNKAKKLEENVAKEIEEKEKEIKLKNKEINELKEENKKIKDELSKLKIKLNDKEGEIEELKAKNLSKETFYKEKENSIKILKKKIENIKRIIESDEFDIKINCEKNMEVEEEIIDSNKKNSDKYGLVGIKNQELNCYMSSVLQILKNISNFSLKIIKIKTQDKIILSLQKLMHSLCFEANEKAVSLLDFKEKFGEEYQRFKGKKNNDSTFFIIYLFQYLHKKLKYNSDKITSIDEFSELKLDKDEIEKLSKFIKKFETGNKSLIIDLFYGYQMNKQYCSGCEQVLISFQSFNILDIPMMDNKNKLKSLEECLNAFLITRDQKDIKEFECTNCRRRLLSHTMSLVKLPPHLIINLKRVGENTVYYHDIEIPIKLKTKNMQKLSKFDKEYKLIGFIKHYGNEQDGHNVAYCENIFDHKWYCFNDSSVNEIYGKIETDGAFLLFYQIISN